MKMIFHLFTSGFTLARIDFGLPVIATLPIQHHFLVPIYLFLKKYPYSVTKRKYAGLMGNYAVSSLPNENCFFNQSFF